MSEDLRTRDGLAVIVDAQARQIAQLEMDAVALEDALRPAVGRYTAALQNAILQERVRREAKRLVDADEHPPTPFPSIESLRDRLTRPYEPVVWRIDTWQPHGANVMIVAPFKGSKTTLRNNYTRSIVDGDLFLGAYRVSPIVSGTVAIIDLEMSETQGTTWFRDQRVRHDDRVLLLHLRGKARAFNILDDRTRAKWAAAFRDWRVDTLMLDCLRQRQEAATNLRMPALAAFQSKGRAAAWEIERDRALVDAH